MWEAQKMVGISGKAATCVVGVAKVGCWSQLLSVIELARDRER